MEDTLEVDLHNVTQFYDKNIVAINKITNESQNIIVLDIKTYINGFMILSDKIYNSLDYTFYNS